MCHFHLTSQDPLSLQKHLFSFPFLIKTRSYVSSQARLELTMYWGMALNFWPACFQLLSARIMVIHHHIQFRWCWVTEFGSPCMPGYHLPLPAMLQGHYPHCPSWHTWNQFNFMWICVILLFFSPLNCGLREGRRQSNLFSPTGVWRAVGNLLRCFRKTQCRYIGSMWKAHLLQSQV